MPEESREMEGQRDEAGGPLPLNATEGPVEAERPLEERVNALVAELEDAKARTLRLMAEYANSQRRAKQNEDQARREGAAEVLRAVVGIVDHLDMALASDLSKASPEQVAAGVRVIREEMLKVLAQQGVGVISPARGDRFNPGVHEAIRQETCEGVESGHIVQTFQAGYTLGDGRVLRPAKVSVAP
jgi:molecular chaperone GrpE